MCLDFCCRLKMKEKQDYRKAKLFTVMELSELIFDWYLQDLKSHAVTLFEVGKLCDESLDSLLVELDKVFFLQFLLKFKILFIYKFRFCPSLKKIILRFFNGGSSNLYRFFIIWMFPSGFYFLFIIGSVVALLLRISAFKFIINPGGRRPRDRGWSEEIPGRGRVPPRRAADAAPQAPPAGLVAVWSAARAGRARAGEAACYQI